MCALDRGEMWIALGEGTARETGADPVRWVLEDFMGVPIRVRSAAALEEA